VNLAIELDSQYLLSRLREALDVFDGGEFAQLRPETSCPRLLNLLARMELKNEEQDNSPTRQNQEHPVSVTLKPAHQCKRQRQGSHREQDFDSGGEPFPRQL